MEPARQPDLQDLPRGLLGLDHPVAFFQGVGHWLFDQHVTPGVQRVDCQVRVQVMPQDDGHRVHVRVFQQLVVVGVDRRDFPLLAVRLPQLLHQVGRGDAACEPLVPRRSAVPSGAISQSRPVRPLRYQASSPPNFGSTALADHGASAPPTRHPGRAVGSATWGVFVRVRVFSKKLLTCSGSHFGGNWGVGRNDQIATSAGMTGAKSRAPSGEETAAGPSTSSGRTEGAMRALGIREWGCVDIRSSVL